MLWWRGEAFDVHLFFPSFKPLCLEQQGTVQVRQYLCAFAAIAIYCLKEERISLMFHPAFFLKKRSIGYVNGASYIQKALLNVASTIGISSSSLLWVRRSLNQRHSTCKSSYHSLNFAEEFMAKSCLCYHVNILARCPLHILCSLSGRPEVFRQNKLCWRASRTLCILRFYTATVHWCTRYLRVASMRIHYRPSLQGSMQWTLPSSWSGHSWYYDPEGTGQGQCCGHIPTSLAPDMFNMLDNLN